MKRVDVCTLNCDSHLTFHQWPRTIAQSVLWRLPVRKFKDRVIHPLGEKPSSVLMLRVSQFRERRFRVQYTQ